MRRDQEGARPAVAEGGPLDGGDLGEVVGDRLEVTMADGTRHLYVRTGPASSGGPAASRTSYEWRGRIGPDSR